MFENAELTNEIQSSQLKSIVLEFTMIIYLLISIVFL